MLDFVKIWARLDKKNLVEIYPKFIIKKSSDLMIRGSDFYAVWDESKRYWFTDEEVLEKLVDQMIYDAAKDAEEWFKKIYILHESILSDCPPELVNIVKVLSEASDGERIPKMKLSCMWDADSGMVDRWHKYCQKQCRDNYSPLDAKLIFSNDERTKKDYCSKSLPYALEPCEISAWEELTSVLYSPEELRKIEWAIGSIITGDSKNIQKFLVMYGAAGTGKSTILNVIQDLFVGYYAVFDAKALGQANSSFALEPFRANPLVAIQHDGDLSRIEDNTRLNSLVSHEEMTVNEKFKSAYSNRFNSFLFMGTNRPVRITDAKSGIIRRLIDVSPTGQKLPASKYKTLTAKIKFELGGIACHCRDVYLEDPGYYDTYIPTQMLGASNDFYNYVLFNYETFKKEDSTTLKQAWELYKIYNDEAKVLSPYPQRRFKEELKNYFKEFDERGTLEDGTRVWNYFNGFLGDKFTDPNAKDVKIEKKKKEAPKEEETKKAEDKNSSWLKLDKTVSLLDDYLKDCPAQYANEKENPTMPWDTVPTKLSDLITTKIHYVRPPINLIIIDFDLKDSSGKKSMQLNLEAASKWPPTYAELSKGGEGIHLHYIYTGDPTMLSAIYDDNIEIKVYSGKAALRRRLSFCNDIPIASISSNLPLKEESKTVNFTSLKNEKALRTVIKRCLSKEYVGGTKPSIEFIKKVLDESYEQGMHYDVTDMRPAISAFAAASTHWPSYCLEQVGLMKFHSEEVSKEEVGDDELVFFDVEVFSNLFVIVWKTRGHDCVKMINPTPTQVEELCKHRLIGFNNLRYDNHILYARMVGMSNEELFALSKAIIGNSKNAGFREAKNISYTDIYDFSSKKQSLKKFEIELGIHHQECGLPWDEPAPEDQWEMVADYCCNDVIATEAVFEARQADYLARLILADVAGMTPNDSTNSLTTRIIFGNERHPNLTYTDLATGEQFGPTEKLLGDIKMDFPGYEFIPPNKSKDGKPHNMYRGEDVGFGGYVYSNPGMYGRTITFDIMSQHPHSIIAMNCFGDYTKNFKDILDTRILIKHKDFEAAKKMFGGKLAKYLDDPAQAKALAQALKIAINSVYGLTSASFDNPFRDPRNVNNIVALRGALFMINLKHEVQDRGFTVAHIKTDSIKVVEPDEKIFDFIMDYGKQYGYTFEIEHKFEKICLVNNAVYIAKCAEDDPDMPGKWEATGTQFQIPYVFKSLFSHDPLIFEDFCATKEVSGEGKIYLDLNEGLPDGEHNYRFVGKVGEFVPMKDGYSAGILYREKDGKYSAVTGTKGYRWLEAETVMEQGLQDGVDKRYWIKLADEAKDAISKFGDYEWFVSE